MTFIRVCLALVLVLCSGIRGMAQLPDGTGVFSVKTLATQGQLPVSNIYTVFQDSEGFMWYGTIGGGLCRDNGYQIDVFRPSEFAKDPKADNVLCLAEDGVGNLWFGTNAGAFRLDRRTMALSLPHGLTGQVFAMERDCNGYLWIGAGRTAYKLSQDSETVLHKYTDLPSWRVSSFYESCDHRFFALLPNVLMELDTQQDVFKPMKTSLPIDPVFMAQDADGGYWIATWDKGVVYFDPQTGGVIEQPATSNHPQCLSMIIDSRHGLMWVASLTNLLAYRISGQRLEAYNISSLVSQESKVLGLMYEDQNKNIWIPSFVPHTFIICPESRNMRRVTVEEMRRQTGFPLLPDRMVILGDEAWILQGRMSLMHYDIPTGRLENVSKGAGYESCIEPLQNGEGLLAAIEKQLVCVTYDGTLHKNELVTLPDYITCFFDSGNGIIYIGSNGAVYSFSLAGKHAKCLCKTEAPIVGMCLRDNNLYYIVRKKGLYKIPVDGSSPPLELLDSPYLSALSLHADGTLWIVGRDGRVYSAESDTVIYENEMSNVHEPLIDVACDHRGHVWTLSDQKAKEYNPKSHSFRTITNSDVGVDYFFHFEKANGDSIGLGATGAFFVLSSTAALDRQSASCNVPRVTAILSGDSVRVVDGDLQEVTIPWDQSIIGFQISTLDILNAGSVCFAYRIEEQKTDWIYLPHGTNTFHLNNLPYGSYHLRLRATDASGCWQAEEGCFLLRHLRPWWQTWWAVSLFAILAFLPLYSLYIIGLRMRKMQLWHRQRRELALTEIAAPSQQELLAEKDKQFLVAARDCVERNLANPQYNVESLSSDLCMSRSNLLRRLQPLTGTSPVEFIRDIRLKHAVQLLSESPDLPMVEVTKRVGFASPSYFSKCFKERFGVLPTQWVNKKNAEKG